MRDREDLSQGRKGMDTVRVQSDGSFQTIQIPVNYNFNTDKLFINRIGDSIVLTPMESLAAAFDRGAAMLSEDFLAEGIPESINSPRESL